VPVARVVVLAQAAQPVRLVLLAVLVEMVP
jgi:hypothetical protein